MSRAKILTLLIAAMGGEGGGVLTDWILAACHASNLKVQATSIPGVAQRTGATTYYLEIAMEKGAETAFCLSPMAGDVDIFASSEYLETGRAILNGLVTPDKTHLIASTHRVFTMAEKMAGGEGVFEGEKLQEAARVAAKSSLLFDMTKSRVSINAVMCGAIAQKLPIARIHFENAIKASKLNVESNLQGFAFGYGAQQEVEERDKPSFPIMQEGIKRLISYQNEAYAKLYVERIERVKAYSQVEPFIEEVARCLALRMSFEDIVRVAQLKISKDRFASVEAEIKAGTRPHIIIDHFKPGIEELASLMPPRFGAWLIAYATKKGFIGTAYLGMKVKTNTIFGFLRIWLLSKLKFLRPSGYRFHEEQKQIESWLNHVQQAYALSPELAFAIVRLSEVIKGYSDTIKRGHGAYTAIINEIVMPCLAGKITTAFALDALLSARKAYEKDPEGDGLSLTLAEIANMMKKG
jgi:indolepyruvate ferredoxin oxidoreductase, beta subunit